MSKFSPTPIATGPEPVTQPPRKVHVIIAAHPRQRSFTLSMARGYAEAVEAHGGRVILRDLYRMRFDPLLHAQEMPDHPGFGPRPDVEAERRLIADAHVYAFFYPLWFNSAPAMIKGYVERVFGMGFAYSPFGLGGNRPLLSDRFMVTFTSTGAPQDWVEESGGRLRALFEDARRFEVYRYLLNLLAKLVPLALFPTWVTWIAYALPPTWGMAAIRASAAGESPWSDVLLCLGTGLAYGLVGALLSETVLRSARRHATLSLT